MPIRDNHFFNSWGLQTFTDTQRASLLVVLDTIENAFLYNDYKESILRSSRTENEFPK